MQVVVNGDGSMEAINLLLVDLAIKSGARLATEEETDFYWSGLEAMDK